MITTTTTVMIMETKTYKGYLLPDILTQINCGGLKKSSG